MRRNDALPCDSDRDGDREKRAIQTEILRKLRMTEGSSLSTAVRPCRTLLAFLAFPRIHFTGSPDIDIRNPSDCLVGSSSPIVMRIYENRVGMFDP